MAEELPPDPGVRFAEGAERAGGEWVTRLIGLTKPIGAVADLDQTISNPPTQAEVQAISDKIDELLAAMRTAGRFEDS